MANLTPGEKRWTVVFGSYQHIQEFAINDLYRAIGYHIPYVMKVYQADKADLAAFEHVFLIGTARNNRHIAELISNGTIPAAPGPQGYTLWIGKAPWEPTKRLVVIAGFDPAGVLYGVQEYLGLISAVPAPADKYLERRAFLEKLPDQVISEAPMAADRGIWTWGFPIFDYRRFLDHMVRLKMNMLPVWNSEAPINLSQIYEEANKRGIRLIVGFNWGWGYNDISVAKAEDRAFIKKISLETYRNEYKGKAIDGIYFQTLTEHKTKEIDGRTIASWCCEMVNDIAKELYAEEPDLHIQFGLHATSIRENYVDLADLDPRMIITWEDYSEGGADAEREYIKKLAAFRPGSQLALVPKGLIALRWEDFEKHGPFILGERPTEFVRERMIGRKQEWAPINAEWMCNYPVHARFYREVHEVNPNMMVTPLIEDANFEACIEPSVALLAEMMWNPYRTDAEILTRALRPHNLHVSV